MTKITAVIAALLLWLIGGQRGAFAQNILDWYGNSQVVCVATAGASVPSQVVHNGTEPVLPIYTQFTLKRATGKGAPGTAFAVASYNYDWYYPPLPGTTRNDLYKVVPFHQGETYLLFLTRKPRFGVERPGLPLRLAAGSASFDPSFLTLGTKLPPSHPSDSPLRAILRILLASLSDKSPLVQAGAVAALGSYGSFLWDYTAYPDLAFPPGGARQSIPDWGYIVAELEETALPALRKRLAAADTDADDRAQLIITLGLLQDINVIPQLLSAAAATHQPFAPSLYVLSAYAVPAALPLLSKEFLSDNAAIATACINSFIKSRDKKAIPMLIDALLHSPNGTVRYTAYYALNEDTGLGGGYGPTDFPAHEQELDRFWQGWLKNNHPTSAT